MARLRIAVDTGGTFTDFVVLDETSGALDVFKVPSTRGHEADGIIAGMRQYFARARASGADVAFFSHGTTVGTNAILEEKGARTGLLVTEGYRGIYQIGEQSRPHGSATYDLYFKRPKALVPPRLTEEVRERVLFDGSVRAELDEDSARAAIRKLVAHGVEAAAVCFLFSFRNGEHEKRVGELFAEIAPQVNVSLSCEVAPQIREYFRLSTTVVNAYLNPLVERYISLLDGRLRELGTAGKQHYIMRSNGGVATFAAAATRSVQTILSGPAAGVVAAARTVAATPGFENVVTFDMGGTSTDVALIERCEPARRMGGKVHGRDVLVPMLDIHTVAAGGGTLAWIDSSGVLQVGPQSAGANPGPACYGLGGTQPTITDANVVLGYLSADNPLAGGALRLDRELAERAVRTIADPLGLSAIDAAKGIVEIVNVKMQEAIKAVSSNRGYDLRDFHLLAFGGAGPLHAAALASELGMKGVLVPAFPGAFSALGLLLSDVRQDYVTSELGAIDAVEPAHVAGVFDALRARGEAELLAQGFAPAQLRFEHAFDLRYVGQGFELTIPVPENPRTREALQAARARFDEDHAQITGHSAPGERVEIVNYRITAVAAVPQASIASPFVATTGAAGAKLGERDTWLGGARTPTALFDRTKLAPGTAVAGPAILLQGDSTTLIPPGQSAVVVELGQIDIRTTPPHPTQGGAMRRSQALAGLALASAAAFAAPRRALAQAALPKIQLAGPPTEDLTSLFYAIKNGLFVKEGFELELVATSSGTAATAAVVAGSYQLAKTSTLPVFNAHNRGIPIAIVAPELVYNAKSIYALLQIPVDSTVKTGADLNGKTIGVPALNDLNQLATRAWVDKNGGDWRSLKFVEVPNSVVEAALQQHRIDAGMMQSPQLDASIAAKTTRTLGDGYGAIAPTFYIGGFIARSDWAAANADIVRKFNRVMAQASGYVNTHPAETLGLMSELTGITIAPGEKIHRSQLGTVMDEALLQPVIDAAAKYEVIAHGFPAKELIATA
jgi:N-methylhydantoinase A